MKGTPMTPTSFNGPELETMTVPAWERAKAAVNAGATERAIALIDDAQERTRNLQVFSIEWITSLLSFIGREMGEDAVERALRVMGEDILKPGRAAGQQWGTLPATARAKVIARAMVANGGTCEVDEDEEKIVLSFRCGSGGRLIDEGRYDVDGGPHLTLRERGGRTFQRDSLPVYCAHCAVHNEIQAIEWGDAPTSIEYPPERPGDPCVHHVYKDVDRMPDEVYVRIGK
jgi:hypothetical protein